MITRTTTIGSLKNYRYNLNHSMTTMSTAMGKITTGRNFNSFAESPATAAQAFQLRHAYLRTASQHSVNSELVHKYEVAWSALSGVESDIDTIDNSGFHNLIRAENGADASARNALGQDMAAKAKSIVQTMNGRYGENYVFSGADTLNVPLTWGPQKNPDYVEDPEDPVHFQYITDSTLPDDDPAKYTNDPAQAETVTQKNPAYDQAIADGIDPDASCPQIPEFITYPKTNEAYNPNASYKYVKSATTIDGKTTGEFTNDVTEANQVLYYRGVPVDSMAESDKSKLDYYTGEERKYIDIGLGYKEKDGSVVSSSVQNSALQGVYYLGGYGTKEVKILMDPDDPSTERTVTVPNNIVSVMSRLGTIMQNCDPDDGSFASEEEEAEFYALAQQYEDVSSLVKQRYTELDTTSSFLKDNLELLEDNANNLQDQFLGIEDVNPAAAISDFMFARYSYDTALKIGNSLLSQSLMDYMSF